ncbi:hypothetical protein Tco_1066735 [Tanacetum coccineum]|uniref:Uncharacterized protein n=1 Tax=Tanacetum coccineum TaxID=301880 RepID=A0ABQ5HB87_9ASTR
MSTSAHFDSEIISQIDEAQSSRVPTPLPDNLYAVVRQAHLVDTDTESGPLEDPRETEIPQPLSIAPSPVLPSDDPCLIVRQAHTPATIDPESEPEEALPKTKEFQPLAARTAPPSLNHTPTSPDSTPVSPLTDEEFEASEPSDTRITSSHSTASSDSTTPLSPGHPLAQTSPAPTRVSYYRSTARMVARSEESKDEGLDSEGEEASPKGHKQQAVLVEVTTAYRPLGLGYGAVRHRTLELAKEISPSTFEVGHSSRSFSPSSLAVPTPVASLVTTSTTTIVVGEDEFLEVGAQLELHWSILHDHTQRLDALPPALFKGYDRDIRELIPETSLESWAGHVDALRAEMWRARYVIGVLRTKVMSTPTHFDSKIILQTDKAQSSRVPTPLPEDPYVTVRQAHLVDTNSESEPFEDYRETKIPQPLPIAQSLTPSDIHYIPLLPKFEGVTDWYQSQVVMSSASSAVTYTFVYTDSEPGKAFWGADDEEVSEGGIPRVIVLGYDGLPIQPPIYPKYIPLEDEHEFPAKEQPLPPIDSPTVESPGYVTKSDPEEDPEEYEDEETEEDEDKDEEDEEEDEEHLAPADSFVIVPTDEPVSPPDGIELVIPPPSTDLTIGARITVRPQTSISLLPETEVKRLLP